MDALTDAQWKTYEEQGYLRLGKALGETELRALQDRINSIMLGEAEIDYDQLLMQLDSDSGAYNDVGVQSNGHKGATLDYRKIQNLENDPVFLRSMQKPLFKDVCSRVYGPETPISCYRAMFMNKPANKGTFLPWHQDRWSNLDQDPLITLWIALDPATVENGCVQVIPGSHHELYNPEHGSGFLREDQAEALCKPEDRIFLEAEEGEVLLLHNWLLHASEKNRSNQSRRAFSVCYMHGNTKTKRKGRGFPRVFGDGALTPDSVSLAKA